MSEDLPAACLHVKQKGRLLLLLLKVQLEGKWGLGLRVRAGLATWGRVRGSEHELCVCLRGARVSQPQKLCNTATAGMHQSINRRLHDPPISIKKARGEASVSSGAAVAA